jgi:hypothetical protein
MDQAFMYSRFAKHLSRHPWQRHLFFLLLAVLATVINGYHYGTFDQVFHITFLKKFVNPSLYPDDPFLSLRWYHFSYFWFPFIPLLRTGLLEISMFMVHILTIYGIFWMFWALSDLLFHSPQGNLLISLALIFPHIGLPGFQIIEFSLLNRTFVLPFLLGCIWLYLKKKKVLAFLLLGLMFNLHVIYAIFVLCMLLLDEAINFSWKSWWKPLLQFGSFFIASLPVLIWRMQTGHGIDLRLRPEMLDLATDGLLYTVYYPIGTSSSVIGNLIAGLGTLWAFILGYKIAPKNKTHKTMRNFALAVGVLVIVSMIASYLLPVTILLQMQILRAAVFMLYFGMLYFSYFLWHEKSEDMLSNGAFALLAVSFILLITPLFAILLYYLSKGMERIKLNPAWAIPVVGLLQGLIIFIAVQAGYWAPGFHIYGPQSAWRDVQIWASQHTPTETKFISPPYIFWHYTPDWRVFSERASIATIPEMMEIPFDPAFAESFKLRFEAVAPGAIKTFDGNYVHTLKITEEKFYTNSEDDFEDIACEFSADALVVERDHPYNFPILYENPGFIVYQLPECLNP